MRLAALVLLAGLARADSSAPAHRVFGEDPMCEAPQHADLHGVTATEYERRALSTFRTHKVFPLWKAAFAFRRSLQTTAPLLVYEPGHGARDVSSFAALQPPPRVGLPSQCSRGCCNMMVEEDTPRWAQRICFDKEDHVRFVYVASQSPALDEQALTAEALTLPPKTPEDTERRRALEANPSAALAMLEEDARAHPRGRWQRDACLPMVLHDGADETIFCMLYLPDGKERLRPTLKEHLRLLRRDVELSPRSQARLPLLMSNDPKLRRMYQLAMKDGLPKSRNRIRWWADSIDSFTSVDRLPPKAHWWSNSVQWCEGSCCSYGGEYPMSCMTGGREPYQIISEICFDDEGQATDVWSYTETEADETCVEDER
jgi:hypothetical protein